MTDLNDTLKQRGDRYGPFHNHAKISQAVLAACRDNAGEGYKRLKAEDKVVVDEALNIIANKLGRIMNGDPLYDDNWRDIAGYATLVERHVNRPEEEPAELKSFTITGAEIVTR